MGVAPYASKAWMRLGGSGSAPIFVISVLPFSMEDFPCLLQ